MFNKFIEITCKKATFFTSKKEEKKITLFENLQLKLHHNICEGCKLFEKQTLLIGKNAAHIHQHTDVVLSPKKKEEIKKLMQLQH